MSRSPSPSSRSTKPLAPMGFLSSMISIGQPESRVSAIRDHAKDSVNGSPVCRSITRSGFHSVGASREKELVRVFRERHHVASCWRYCASRLCASSSAFSSSAMPQIDQSYDIERKIKEHLLDYILSYDIRRTGSSQAANGVHGIWPHRARNSVLANSSAHVPRRGRPLFGFSSCSTSARAEAARSSPRTSWPYRVPIARLAS